MTPLLQRINELSKGKLHAYISQAVQSYGDAKADLRTDAKADKLRHKATKRYVGIDRAVSRIAKRVPANEVKTYVRSPWRRTIGTSSAAHQAPGIKPLTTTPETDETKAVDWDMEKAIAAAKERLKFRGKRRRFYGGEETTEPSLNELMLERAKQFGIAGQIAHYQDKISRETIHEENWYGNALNRKGKTIGKSGPHSSREEAKQQTHIKYPKAHSISTGYGNGGGFFDIRNHSKNYDGSLREADIIQQVAGLAIKAGVKGLRRLISGPGKIRAGRVKPIKKTTSVAPQSNPPQTVKPSNPPLNQGPWGERPFSNSPPHIKQTVETPSTSGGINPSNKMSGSDFRALIAKNPKLKIGAGKK